MVRVAVDNLDDELGTVDRDRIEGTVRRLVHDWIGRARVKIFVGIIAERHARRELEQDTGHGAADRHEHPSVRARDEEDPSDDGRAEQDSRSPRP